MSKPLDYSKWDNFGDSSDDDAPPPPRRAAASGAAAAASQPGAGSGAASESAETCEYSEAELLAMQDYEVERPERLSQLLKTALDALERDIDAPSPDALANSDAVPLFTTVRG